MQKRIFKRRQQLTTVDSNNYTVYVNWTGTTSPENSKTINQSQTASKQQQTLKRLIWKDLRDRYRQQTRENFWCALAYYSLINQAFRNQGIIIIRSNATLAWMKTPALMRLNTPARKSQTLWSTLSTQERLLFQLWCFNVCLCITADLKWFNTHSHLPVAWSTFILCSRCLVVVSFSFPTIGWRQRKVFSNRNKMKAWI